MAHDLQIVRAKENLKYHNFRKTFSKLYGKYYDLMPKLHVGLKGEGNSDNYYV